MIDLLLNKATGPLDLVIINSDLQIVEGEDAERQALEFKLEFFENDWELDLSFGIPYYGRVFQDGVNNADLQGIFRTAIEEEPYIERVDDLTLNIDSQTRILNVSGGAFSKSGDLISFSFTNGSL